MKNRFQVYWTNFGHAHPAELTFESIDDALKFIKARYFEGTVIDLNTSEPVAFWSPLIGQRDAATLH